ncbi:hypothetical protein RJ53_09415 [Methanocalculus chunghsingensis]|uniref:Csm6 6H domain-containing protein n=1 Tax=Methanocalculus chunghsingensis TaxID=156457 RepID=A0A8J7W8H7_9EURY|nr:TIGR02710 family CRISPR-associated CARF protein [Methanocalculus chunghsingensis]MBR1369681.1 hypothetical protein [Methanocalculus chunghsingensis]
MVTLFMTVGTGSGPDREERMRNLAHGLAHGIHYHRPEEVIFFGSAESEPMVPLIRDCLKINRGMDLPPVTWIQLRNIDSFSDCFEQISDEIKRRPDEDIRIDYTSGTKTMTMSAAIASMLHRKELTVISGRRGENGLVGQGTETITQQSLYLAYNDILRETANAEFNAYRFESAKATMRKMVAVDDKNHLMQIFDAYSLWDRFDHKGAAGILAGSSDTRFSVNKGFIKQLVETDGLPYKYRMILADLLNNAGRRIEEGKYDDATGRLYRAVELITQIRLLEYDLDDINGSIRLEKLKGKVDREYFAYCEPKADGERRLRIGVREKFHLLQALGWTRARTCYEALADDLQQRNSSILAHGMTPVTRESAMTFYGKVHDLALQACGPNEMEPLLKRAVFTKL